MSGREGVREGVWVWGIKFNPPRNFVLVEWRALQMLWLRLMSWRRGEDTADGVLALKKIRVRARDLFHCKTRNEYIIKCYR